MQLFILYIYYSNYSETISVNQWTQGTSVSSVYDSATSTTPRPRDNPHVTCCVSSSLMIDIFHFILIANKHKIICAVPSGDEMTVIRECFTEQSARSCKRTAKESDNLHGFLQKILISFHRFFKLFVMNMFNNDQGNIVNLYLYLENFH